MIIDSVSLNPLLLDAFSKKITWLEASTRYPVEDFIDTFFQTRQLMQKTITGLTDADVWFASDAHPFWSLSETITHLIYSQGFYHNKLLEIATSQLPHAIEAARGFGEGAQLNIPADALRTRLQAATIEITTALEATRSQHDPNKVEFSPLFGECTYRTWVLLLLGHEVDHVRQSIIMRRTARLESR
jgi:uncharacterized damage-inducible protein DinB